MIITTANIVTAFDSVTIGTKVTDTDGFYRVLTEAIKSYDFDAQRIPGQGFIVMPEAMPFVSAGDGERTEDPADYEPHLHRGNVELFLKRRCAGKVTFCACVVYTHKAYVADPDVAGDEEELARVKDADYVLVAVLANSGPKGPITPGRMVYNMAGHNNDDTLGESREIDAVEEMMKFDKTVEIENPSTQSMVASVVADARKAHAWAETAKDANEYWSKYCVVAG